MTRPYSAPGGRSPFEDLMGVFRSARRAAIIIAAVVLALVVCCVVAAVILWGG